MTLFFASSVKYFDISYINNGLNSSYLYVWHSFFNIFLRFCLFPYPLFLIIRLTSPIFLLSVYSLPNINCYLYISLCFASMS